MTEDEFNAELARMGIEQFRCTQSLPTQPMPQTTIGFKRNGHTFKTIIPLDSLKDLQAFHGIDALPETRSVIIEGLHYEVKFLLLNAKKIDEFIALFGWDDLENFANQFPIVRKWLADPTRGDKKC